MRIYYLASSIIPSRAANSIHVMKMVNAMNRAGHEAILIVPRQRRKQEKNVNNVFEFYGVDPFRIVYFPWFQFPGSKYIYSFLLSLCLFFKNPDLVYSRDFYSALHASLLGLPTVMEFHGPPKWGKWIYKHLVWHFYKSRYTKKLVVISEALKNIFKDARIPEYKILVAHDASDPAPRDVKDIKLKGDFKAGYVGHLYPGKGMEIIAAVAPNLPGVQFHIVGGLDKDINKWKDEISTDNIEFHGYVPHGKIHEYIKQFDVCLLPNQKVVKDWGGIENIGEYTSPLKMFDYMAGGEAIIASDLPVLREVLDDTVALFCKPKNFSEWEDSIIKLKENEELRAKLGENALKRFNNHYTWDKRCEKVLKELS